MNRVQLSHRMYSLSDLKRLFEGNELRLQPKYQRRRTAWPITAKSSLIDTIISNYPIHPIYLSESTTLNLKRIKEIIDGQQRVSTIIEFLNDEFPLGKNISDSHLNGLHFSELPFETKENILDYELSFMSIRGATESDIIAIFSKLNSFTLPLNDQEKRNATWSGQFKSLVYKLSSIYFTFWIDFKIFTDKAIARMKEAQLISELLVTIEIGYDNYSKSKINEVYKKYDQNFQNWDNYYDSFNNIMSVIGNVMEENKIKNHFRKQSWFFTLFLVLFEKVYFEIGSTKKSFKGKSISIQYLKANLIELIEDYEDNNFDEAITLLFRQGTGAAQNRKARHQFLIDLI